MRQRILSIIALLIFCGRGTSTVFAQSSPSAPSYDTNFAWKMTDGEVSVWALEDKVKGKTNLTDNIKALLKPNTTSRGDTLLEKTLKTIAIGAIIFYLVRAGVKLVISGSQPEELKNALKNFWFIALGAVLIYCAGRLFGADGIISFWAAPWWGGTAGLEGVAERVSQGNDSLFFQMLTLLKGAAFFFAIVMIVVTGFQVVSAADADKSKKLVRGVLNVVWGLAIMKVVDFIYYIASVEDFAAQATEFILDTAEFFGYLYGSVAVLMVFYAGYSFLTDGGGGDGFKRAKNILINLLVSGLVLFGFLLILYQVFAEFT